MSDLTKFRLEFDRAKAAYAPTERVTGHIIIALSQEKEFCGLNLSVVGEANVLWYAAKHEKDEQGNRRTLEQEFKSSERYLSLLFPILASRGGNDRRILPKGVHKYPFHFDLPKDIPSSLEHKHGHIKYTVKAVITRSWTFDHECDAVLTVIAPLDLNANKSDCLALNRKIQKNFSFCCCFSSGSMKARITLPTSGVIPGQTIDPVISFQNLSRSVGVMRVCVKLMQCLKFHSKEPISRTKTDNLEIKSTGADGPFSESDQVKLRLLVPAVTPSRLEHCNIIDQEYYLRVSIHFPGCHLKLREQYRILIGTVPLHEMLSAPFSASTTQKPPSPPSAEAMDHNAGSSTGFISQFCGCVSPRTSNSPPSTNQGDIHGKDDKNENNDEDGKDDKNENNDEDGKDDKNENNNEDGKDDKNKNNVKNENDDEDKNGGEDKKDDKDENNDKDKNDGKDEKHDKDGKDDKNKNNAKNENDEDKNDGEDKKDNKDENNDKDKNDGKDEKHDKDEKNDKDKNDGQDENAEEDKNDGENENDYQDSNKYIHGGN